MVRKVLITYEVNCHISEPSVRERLLLKLGFIQAAPCRGYASLWATVEPYNTRDDDYTERGVKIVGPLPSEHAQSALASLRHTLEAAGVPVEVEIAADD